ncbi:hypothetical protein C7974DRAFT_399689 [Boeremia exigua]|uniref:uncharacterized protein n=1 Tax=Boeremia exigua TaxID=749465 RepID=UPI001E8D10F5|nr:uncharacterized protein C7974DRAFT_399689 [Boeremia exigua]KAH6620425.1 hypothetical protein C7974DRAFT_399689 [Boeremia exigua]
MSVSYVLLMMCVIILGSAWHGPSGEAWRWAVQERGGSWLVHELKHAETSPILVVNEQGWEETRRRAALVVVSAPS